MAEHQCSVVVGERMKVVTLVSIQMKQRIQPPSVDKFVGSTGSIDLV